MCILILRLLVIFLIGFGRYFVTWVGSTPPKQSRLRNYEIFPNSQKDLARPTNRIFVFLQNKNELQKCGFKIKKKHFSI